MFYLILLLESPQHWDLTQLPAISTWRTSPILLLLLLTRFSRVRLRDPRDGSPPGSPVPGILQARTLEWAAISFSNAGKWKVKVKSLSCVLTLRDPMDCSPPGSCLHGIFQARVLEWDAIAFCACPLTNMTSKQAVSSSWRSEYQFLRASFVSSQVWRSVLGYGSCFLKLLPQCFTFLAL